jgi:3-deoxy-7-phosphoheptulonate synthase
MLESNIHAGNQSTSGPKELLKYGISVTDACISFDDTTLLLANATNKLNDALKNRLM